MSKQYPECPLYNHNTCKEIHNPKLCALVREDKKCLRKLPKHIKRQKTVKEIKLITDDKWKTCRHIMGETADSVVGSPEKIAVCRPCAVSGIEKLYPIGKKQLLESIARAGIKELLSLDDVFPKSMDKSNIHPLQRL